MNNARTNLISSLGNVRDIINDIVANTGAALANPQIRIRHETLQCGAVVLMTGYFEAFLKDVVRAFIDSLCNRNTDFHNLPDKIRQTHYESGGKVLEAVAKARRSGNFTPLGTASPEDVVERLWSPGFQSTPTNYVILWEAFAITNSNPSPTVVNDIGRGLGMTEVWSKIAMHSGSGHTHSTLSATLQNLIIVRNSCAHTGTVNPLPSTADILFYLDSLEWIATGLVGALQNELIQY